jgi:hypothetical protein
MSEDSIILIGGPEDLSESLMASMNEIIAGRRLHFSGVRALAKDMCLSEMLGRLEQSGAPEVSREHTLDILVTKKYFKNLTHQPLKINRTNISVYAEKDGKFEIWGYF